MDKLPQAQSELREMDPLAAADSPVHRLHPICKLAVTLLYIVIVVSFPKYDLSGLIAMVFIPRNCIPDGGNSNPALLPKASLCASAGLRGGSCESLSGSHSLCDLGLFHRYRRNHIHAHTAFQGLLLLNGILPSDCHHFHRFHLRRFAETARPGASCHPAPAYLSVHRCYAGGSGHHVPVLPSALSRAERHSYIRLGFLPGAAAAAKHGPCSGTVQQHVASGLSRRILLCPGFAIWIWGRGFPSGLGNCVSVCQALESSSRCRQYICEVVR